MTPETLPSIVGEHRTEAFLQSLDEASADDGLLGVMACYELYLRMREMYAASALIRGDEGDEADDCMCQELV